MQKKANVNIRNKSNDLTPSSFIYIMKKHLIFIALFLIFNACQNNSQTTPESKLDSSELMQAAEYDSLKAMAPVFSFEEPLNLTEEDWKTNLTDDAYYILRKGGTERAFTGEYWDNKEEGLYTCAGCGLALFSSDHKYKSGSGWPSYYQPLDKKNIAKKKDRGFGMARTEILCARCGGHLGHVFDDGPKPTGLRYCVNSASLEFYSEEKSVGE
jgi:peptide-methionine (R)-S-oxide reductase